MSIMSATKSRFAAQPLQLRRPPCQRRPLATPAQALFGLFSAKPRTSPTKAKELVDNLLELTETTDGGLKASPATRQQIAELVQELEGFCPNNPLRSPLLYGDYDVLYASKPQAAGGGFLRSAPGQLFFAGQRPVQRIQPSNRIINEVSYKALGLLPGSARQEGEFEALNGSTFELTFPKIGFTRVIRILYLDERVRVAQSLPPEGEDREPVLFVFRRIEESAGEEEEQPQGESSKPGAVALGTRRIKAAAKAQQESTAPPRRGVLGTQLLGSRGTPSLATIAERRYAKQQGGTGSAGRAGTGTGGRGTGTASKSREEIAAERAASRAAAEEERRAAREAAAAAKAAAEEERRARQAQLEEERARQAELKEAIRAQLAALKEEERDAVEQAKAAAAAAKDAEKATSTQLQQARQARNLISDAVAAATSALQQLDELKAREAESNAAAAEARQEVKWLQTAGQRK